MYSIDHIGEDWVNEQYENRTYEVERIKPSDYNEKTRYLPASVTSMPGYIRFDVNPYMKEIVDCFDINSPVREVNVMKGVQITYTTLLESGILYYADHVGVLPMMYMTADKELATARIENNLIPMFQQSDKAHIIRSSDEGNTRKSGKALDVETVIPTPNGTMKMGDLSVGDYVFSIDGTATKIITESPIHNRPCYEVSFANGEKIIASDDHRWTVCPHGNVAKDITITTKELFELGVKKGKDYRYRVRVASPVDMSDKLLEIEPYTLGAWLGDGDSAGARITPGDDEKEVTSQIENDGYFVKRQINSTRCDTYTLMAHRDYKYNKGYGFKAKLDCLNLVNNKHIPEIYFLSSIEQRTRLMQGLMDTDGSTTKCSGCEITQKNKKLAYGIWRLASSLGFKATIRHRTAKSQNGTVIDVYRVLFSAKKSDKPFTLKRKLDRLKDSISSRTKKNSIVSIIPVGDRTVKCIGVEHHSKLFLCGYGHIPTHNTANHLQFAKGAYLVPFGARNADKMRSYSIAIMLKDEIDAWPETVGRDGDPDALSDARTDGYSETSKIFRGSTPLIKSSSKIYKNYLKGDQRKYMVLCKSCSYPQELRWYTENKENGIIGGFDWQMEDGILLPESVHYACFNCGHKHYDHDKEFLYSPKNGAHWKATAKPVSYGVRSYHLPALYSPVGMRPWSKNVLQYIEAYDRDEKKVKDIGKYQVFYNNVLAMPFEVKGAAIRFSQVSSHRRQIYRLGQVPNNYAKDYSRSKILFLTCQIDVHKSNLAVSIMGWCKDAICYVIDYVRIEVENDDKDCSEIDSPVWNKVRELIEEKIYIADDGTSYNIAITLIDAGYANDTVTTFCSEYAGGVFPILGRDRAAKNQTIKEFAEFKTQAGTVGYRILVDHYKDRMGPVLRREWYEDFGEQKPYHFNAPVDITDKQLKELTVETRKEKIDDKGHVSYFWHRPGNARNELFDLLGYGYAATEILAWNVCIQTFELETIDWARFWEYLETEALYFKDDVKVNDDKT